MHDSPRENDNLGVLAFYKENYWSGDDYKEDFNFNDFGSLPELGIFLTQSKFIWLPVYGYVHSAASICTEYVYPYTCRWDGGLAGVIYAKPEKIKEWLNVKYITKKVRERVKEILRAEVKEYDDYLNGTGEYAPYHEEDCEDDE